jgi:uncharacterized DUF497 family protein
MDFEWDEGKRREVLEKRGVDILYAALIFENVVLTWLDDRRDYGEAAGFSGSCRGGGVHRRAYRAGWRHPPDHGVEGRTT